MTVEQINRRREHMAMGLLARSGVGYIYAANALEDAHIDKVKDIGLAGSEPEALVKVALQFAFGNPDMFKTYIENTAACLPGQRWFRAVR